MREAVLEQPLQDLALKRRIPSPLSASSTVLAPRSLAETNIVSWSLGP
jgi:hypothetical protein